MVLRRIAGAIDRRPKSFKQRRAILNIAAADFVTKLRPRDGKEGGRGYSGWEISNLAQAAFWSTLLLSARRERFAMTLLGQLHEDTAAVRPYVQEKRATEEILDAIPGIDVDSLIGFVDVAVSQFHPPGVAGAPLVPAAATTEILRAALLRGAMVGELRAEAIEETWLATHPESAADPAKHWRTARRRAEELFEAWRKQRRTQGRRLV